MADSLELRLKLGRRVMALYLYVVSMGRLAMSYHEVSWLVGYEVDIKRYTAGFGVLLRLWHINLGKICFGDPC